MFAIISIVIVIIPVALGAPTVPVFIPPTMVAGVAILAGFVELTASVIGLTALASMMLNSFMETMVGPGNALLTIVIGAARKLGAPVKSRNPAITAPASVSFAAPKILD